MIKIVDFGIAKAAMNVSHTMAGILKGKIAYMSPEQALGKPIDFRTDVFSAGVVLYEMLTGEKLFTGETQFEVLNQIRTTRISTMMLPDYIPGPLKAILAKALAYNIKDRYQSAGDFQLDLTKYLYSSFIDFSPRHLSKLLGDLFEKEIRRRESPLAIDEQTRSVLVRQATQESVVVPGPAQVTDKVAAPIAEPFAAPIAEPFAAPPKREIGISGPHVAAAQKKKGLGTLIRVGGSLVVLILIAYVGYEYLLKGIFKKEAVAPLPTEELPITEEVSSIVVDSEPPGAKIFLNGEDTGLTSPATLPKLAMGDEYQIRLVKENYREASKTVAVTSEEPIQIKETLRPFPLGIIEVESNPPGAKISLNDQDTGLVTPAKFEKLEIQKGYTVKLSLPDYNEWTQSVELRDFSPVKVQTALTSIEPPPVTEAPPAPPVTPETPPTPTPPAEVVTPAPPTEVATPTPPPTAVPEPVLTPPPPPPSPPPPSEPVISYGKIKISSSPRGAKVYLNGSYTGDVTPATLDKLEAGKKVTVSLAMRGYKEWSRSVTVEKDRTTPLTASLKEIVVERPYTPPPPPPVVEEKPYKPPPAPTPTPKPTPAPRETPQETASVNLRGKVGEIKITSYPSGAKVIYDGGTVSSRTPVTISGVPRDKTHNLKLRLDGYRDWETTVNLSDQKVKKYEVHLKKE